MEYTPVAAYTEQSSTCAEPSLLVGYCSVNQAFFDAQELQAKGIRDATVFDISALKGELITWDFVRDHQIYETSLQDEKCVPF